METNKQKCCNCDSTELHYRDTDKGELLCYDCGQEVFEERIRDEFNLGDLFDQVDNEEEEKCVECNGDKIAYAYYEDFDEGEIYCDTCAEEKWWDVASEQYTPEDANLEVIDA